MFRNYFITAWRNLIKGKSFSLINIAGLAVGIACASLIFLWVNYNITYNHSIPDLNNIYQVKNNQTYGKDMYTFSSTPPRLKGALLQEFPGVKNASRYSGTDAAISLGDNHLTQRGAYVDSGFLKMFGFPVVKGNENNALNDVSQIAISQKLAKNYFGNINVIGKTLLVDKQPYKVSVVYKDIPENVEFYGIDFLLTFKVLYTKYKQYKQHDTWGNNNCETWVQLKPKANFASTNKKLKKLLKEKQPDNSNVLFLYPLKREALYGRFTNGKEDTSRGKIQYIKMFSLVAFIILIIACINFMNLSTARSGKRTKEIGVHKVLGSTRSDLIGRFLSESLVVAYVAVLLAIIIIALVLPMFSSLIGVPLHLWSLSNFLFLFIVGTACGLFAGIYPALYLSSFNPIRALKNQIIKNTGNANFVRKGLVIIQFTTSVIIIIAVIVIYNQIQFTKNRDLGFNKNNVLYVSVTPTLMKGYASLKQNILSTNNISAVSLGAFSPLNMYSNGGGYNWKGKSDAEEMLVTFAATDADYLKTFGIQLKAGKGFSQDEHIDSMNIIINESFAKIMGEAGHIGGKIWGGNNRKDARTIIGITKKFVYNDMTKMHSTPLVFINNTSYANYIYMKLKPTDNLQGVISKLQGVFKSADASQPFNYHFVDDDFNKKFKYQQFIGSIATIFGFLSIFISCLGLFGLAAFTVEQRKKEIGVRKVLGASVFTLWKMLSKEFTILVIIACFIAIPLAWYYLNEWLQQYDYRTELSFWIFLVSGLLALIITLITISFQSIKAATANPIKSLRTE